MTSPKQKYVQPKESSSSSSKKNIWADLPRRLATICIGIPIVWKLLSDPTLALAFFTLAHALATWEFALLEPSNSMSSNTNTNTNTSKTKRLGFCIVSLLLAHIPTENDALFQLCLCCTAGVFCWIQRHHWIVGLVVLTIPFRTAYWLSQDFSSTISLLLVVWNCDTGALIFGRLAAKVLGSSQNNTRRLPMPTWIRQISPAKSMEGFIGGILGGTWTAVSWIPAIVSWANIETSSTFDALWAPWSHRIGLGISLSFLGIVGDLVESSIKRQAQSKDSGSFLPGHGGILDRCDSALLGVLLYQVLYYSCQSTINVTTTTTSLGEGLLNE